MSRWVAGVVAVLVLAGCGGDSLAERDPAGYEACQSLVRSRDADVDQVERFGAKLFDIGNAAKDSTTPEIREAATPLFDEEAREAAEDAGSPFPATWDVDEKAMVAVCESEGIEIPAVQPS